MTEMYDKSRPQCACCGSTDPEHLKRDCDAPANRTTEPVDISEKAVARLAIAMQLNGRNDVHDMLLALLNAVGRTPPADGASRAAACATLVAMMEDYIAQPPDGFPGTIGTSNRWHWTDEKLREVLDACKGLPAKDEMQQFGTPGENHD